jgi:hypothetical protein
METDQIARSVRGFFLRWWKGSDPRGKLAPIVGVLAVLCFLVSLIVPADSTGSPGHLIPLHRPALRAESVRIDAGGVHEMPIGWAFSYGIFGVSQTPGEAELWVDGRQVAVLKWTDYRARRKAFCVSPAIQRLPSDLATVVPGSTVTVVPRNLTGDWYVDIEMFPTVKECA